MLCCLLLTNGTVKMSHQKIDDITCKGNFRLTFCLFCLLKRELDMTAAHSETQKMDNCIIIHVEKKDIIHLARVPDTDEYPSVIKLHRSIKICRFLSVHTSTSPYRKDFWRFCHLDDV